MVNKPTAEKQSNNRNAIYFASDLHLGAPSVEESRKREVRLCKWLDEISSDAKAIYLIGDIFDFWAEYRNVVPKGHVRFLGKIAELTDAGIQIHFFTGNHDPWLFDYLPNEIGVTIHRNEIEIEDSGKKFYLAHGDGLGPGDHGYKFLKKALRTKFVQWCFARVHANFGVGLFRFFSTKSRKHKKSNPEFLGEDKEWLVQHSKEILTDRHIDYFIYGHRHTPIVHPLSDKSSYINLGDWIVYDSYVRFCEGELEYIYWKS